MIDRIKRLSGAAALGLALTAGLGAAPAAAEPTPITVHVISQGAKFIGTSMGGVHVTITDVRTGEVLASGTTTGSTGDTGHIMKTAHQRGTPLSKGGAAKFEAALDLDEPRKLKVTARGPTAQAQAANTVSSTQWVLPGKGVSAGDGWLLEMPGFMVDLEAPPAHDVLTGTPQTVQFEANVTMMCGCPIAPDGLWDANAYEIRAMIYRNGAKMDEVAMAYDGEVSQFAANVTLDKPGNYEVVAYAYDPTSGGTGLDKTTFAIK
jgi:hypothetical protein